MEAVKLGKPPFVAAALRVRQLIASLAQKHLAQSAILPPPLLSEPRAHNAEVERVVNSFAVQKVRKGGSGSVSQDSVALTTPACRTPSLSLSLSRRRR
mmetsp:Transcript_15771/g.60023  ORF Transcript_15771/g.60023 Transcript_15771/m.60023 type:complete len:98 (+) Transcript_15771:95-388(+)